MQGTPVNFLLEEQFLLQQDTDTATARTPIPIYYIHDGETPFCQRPHCFCQRGKRAGALLYRQIAEGRFLLAQLAAGAESREQAMSQRTGTTPPPISRVYVPLVDGIPADCQLYGHSWEITENPDVKECSLCHVQGYCPGCTPLAPLCAQPFTCTAHAQQRQAEP